MWRCATCLGPLLQRLLCRARTAGAGSAGACAWAFPLVHDALRDHRPCHSLTLSTDRHCGSQVAVHGGRRRRQCIWQSSCRTLLEPPWHQAWRCFVDVALQWALAVTVVCVRAEPTCRTAWRGPAVLLDTVGRLECSTMPVTGIVGHLERQWRAAAARRQRQRLDKRGSAFVGIANNALGGIAGGSDGVSGLLRLRQFCCHGSRVWRQSATGLLADGPLSTPWARIDVLLACTIHRTSKSKRHSRCHVRDRRLTVAAAR